MIIMRRLTMALAIGAAPAVSMGSAIFRAAIGFSFDDDAGHAHHVELEARGRVRERSERKAIVEVTVTAAGVVTARGEVVAVAMPAAMARS
jgi:hypothetical protein